ncbi:Ig-like domain-containing protein [Pseudochrobactrum asaccharolyticum]|uniref:Big-1 domain-containing protein n=1 Tax=Pseudochrobactrum asaccharolyticum TaxID=354351 RepID=A0A366E0T9_9HYPH|nr:Ig-like domain-containing protein [Pseudochrobactrum asaccharolyticum]RBO95952.1 hypothetical protein DFR47_103517 [Pseudochrobactrum asaccharolyticum]
MTDPNIDNDNAIDPVMSDLSLEDQAQLFQLLKVEAGMTLTMRKNGAVADGVDVDIAQVTFNNMDEGTKPLVVDYKIEGGTAVFQENKLTTIRKNTNKSLSSTVQLINLTPGKGMIKATPYLNPKMAPAPVEYEFIGKPYNLDLKIRRDEQFADGIAENRVLATLTDNNGKPVIGADLELKLSGKALFTNNTALSIRPTDENGQFDVGIKATENADISVTYTVTLVSDPSVTQSVVVKFKARLMKLDLTIGLNDQFSDGVGQNKVLARLIDQNNTPVSGANLELKLNGNALFTNGTALSIKSTNANGEFNVGIISSANANISVKYIVTLVSDRSITKSVDVRFKAKPPQLVLTINKNGQYSDGTGVNEVLATLTDHNNKPVSGAQLELKLNGNAKFTNGTTISTLPTRSDGTFNIGILSTANANISVTYTVTLVSDRSVTKSVDVRFKAKPVARPPSYLLTITAIADNTLTHTKTSNLAGGGNVASVRLTYGGQPVPNANINCSFYGSGYRSGIANNATERLQQVGSPQTNSINEVVMRTNANGEFIVRMGIWNNLFYSTRETGTLSVSYNNIKTSRVFTFV